MKQAILPLICILLAGASSTHSQTMLNLSRNAGADPGPGMPACEEDPGWFSLFDGTGESVTKYFFNPSGQRHGDNSRWWVADKLLHSDQSTDRRGGLIYTKRQYKNVEFKTHIKPYWRNDGGYFFRSNTAGRAYQVVIDYVPGTTKAIGGIWGEGRTNPSNAINYKPFGFNSPTSITLRSEWHLNGTAGRENLTAADWSTKVWKADDYNWVAAKIYNNDVPYIDTYINGYQMVHYRDPANQAALEVHNGHIGLQIHQGAGAWSINNPNLYKAILVREVRADGNPLDAYPDWKCGSTLINQPHGQSPGQPSLNWAITDNVLRIHATSPSAYELHLSDLAGKTIYQKMGSAGNYEHSVKISQPGVHLLTVRTENQTSSYKIVQTEKN